MIRFIAANGLAVCSISTIVKQPESIRSISCTLRVMVPQASQVFSAVLVLVVDHSLALAAATLPG